MSNVSCAAFKTQIAAIMDVLAKAAIAEISKLVEDDHVLVRLEMCRRENEIATLKKRLILTEMDLKNAQRAATRMPTERVSVATQVESSEDEYQHVIHTLEEAIPKAEGKISIEEPVRPASFPLNGDREILQNVTNSVPTGEDDRSISDFPMKREQDSGSSTLPECQYRSKDMYSQSDDQTNKLLQSWPAFDEANCQEEYPGCSYNTDLNSSSEANLFSVANTDSGTEDFPDDLQLDLFNSVSVKEEDVSMSVSQDFLNTIAQTKDGHLKESVNTSTVSSMGQSDPRVEKSSSSFSHSINVPPIASSHGTASFLPTDSQSQPTQPTLGALIHRPTTTQVSPQSQALSVMHVPYTQGRHLLTRPRTPSLMHRRAGVGIGMGHTSHHRVFICSLCGKSFPRFCQLEAHQSSHSGVKPYRCTECGKRFTQKTRLKTHQSVHTGERPFSCRLCGKRFNRQDNCLRHERFHRAKNPSSRLGLGRGLSN